MTTTPAILTLIEIGARADEIKELLKKGDQGMMDFEQDLQNTKKEMRATLELLKGSPTEEEKAVLQTLFAELGLKQDIIREQRKKHEEGLVALQEEQRALRKQAQEERDQRKRELEEWEEQHADLLLGLKKGKRTHQDDDEPPKKKAKPPTEEGGEKKLIGVSASKTPGRWRARINIRGRRCHVGTFGSREDAGRAFDQARVDDQGERATELNFPENMAFYLTHQSPSEDVQKALRGVRGGGAVMESSGSETEEEAKTN